MINKPMPDFFMSSKPRTRNKEAVQTGQTGCQRLAAIYLLRLTLGLQKHLNQSQVSDLFDEDFGPITGLDAFNDGNNIKLKSPIQDEAFPYAFGTSKTVLLKCVRQQLTTLLREGVNSSESLFTNIELLSQTLNLSPVEQEILVLRLLMVLIRMFCQAVINLCSKSCTTISVVDYLRIMTNRPAQEIERALQPNSQLLSIGWLKINPSLVDMEDKLIVANGILDILLRPHESAEALFNNFFKLSSATELVAADYAHLQQDLDVVHPYLLEALKNRQTGINILIYGPPGIGKTQFAKLLAQTLSTPLYEVLCANEDGLPMRGDARFAACQLSQKLLGQKNTPSLLLFDEAEDVFPAQYTDFFNPENKHSLNHGDKAWINQQLENNPIPIIWISNRTKGIDPAYLRRFSYSIEMDKMPTSVRRRIINKYCHDLQVSADWQANLVNQLHLTPAQIEQACAVARAAQNQISGKTELIAERVLTASTRLLKQKQGIKKNTLWTHYDRTLINTNLDLEALLTGLQHHRRGNFCFYGAPGTGKTALARHIAETLGLPLHSKRASDVLDKYVGGSEKNIARMFADAQKQGAVLLLDEADSLLSDRLAASQQWQITQINEMLTQMETFSGIFICTTNLMTKLDAASLRRFDFKVKFDYLNPEQRWTLFQQESRRLGSNLPRDHQALQGLKDQVHRLTKLTPGDFAVLNRQVAVLGRISKPEQMLAVLTQECLAKGESFAKIGFVH